MKKHELSRIMKAASQNKLRKLLQESYALPTSAPEKNQLLNSDDFSERIWKLRREKGLTQKELAERIGVSAETVKKWESTERIYPNAAALCKLSALFNVDIEYLITDTEVRRRAEVSAADYTGLSSESIERIRKLPLLLTQTLDALLQYGDGTRLSAQTFTGLLMSATAAKEASGQNPSEVDKDEYELQRDYDLALFNASNDLTAMLRALYPLKSRNAPESR